MNPPGPRQPSIVQLWHFTQRPLPWLEECARRFGDPFTVRFPGLGTYVLASAPELIREIFTGDDDALHAGKANAMLEPIVGRNSVLLLDGAPHLRQRRLLSPPLRGERMQAYATVIADATGAALARMPRGTPFAAHDHMQAITLDVILRAVFGLEEGAGMTSLRRMLVELLEPPPAFFAFLPPRWLDFPGSPYRTLVRRRRAVDAAIREILRARRAAPGGTDILSLLLAVRDDQGAPMTDDELVDELITMLVAGHETTATALSWAFACILEHPEVERRLTDELAGVTDPAALAQHDYLDAVVKETLRLRPILPDVVRLTQRPVRFAGYDIPAGVNLTPCIYLAHRRPEVYPEPARFRPERFLGVKAASPGSAGARSTASAVRSTIDPYAWLPFGGGIRRCLGMAFALYEMKIVLGTILTRARPRLANPGPVRVVRRTITLAPEGGTQLVL